MYVKNDRFEILTPTGFKDFQGVKKNTSTLVQSIKFNSGIIITGSPSHQLKIDNKKTPLNQVSNDTVSENQLISGLFNLYSVLGVSGEEFIIQKEFISLNCAYIKEKLFEEFYSSVYPTISSGKESKIIITSSAKDINHFYELWKNANEDKNTYKPIEISWRDVPGRDSKWKEQVISDIGQKRFDREFDNQFFGKSSVVIPIPLLKSLTCLHPISERNDTKIFEFPDKNYSYIGVADVAEGKGDGDYSTLIIIKLPKKNSSEPYKVVFTFRSDEIDIYSFIETVFIFLTKYNEALLIPEVNFHDIATSLYRDFEYINIIKTTIRRQKISTAWTTEKTKLGIKTTAPIKKLGLDSLLQMFEQNSLIISDINILKELSHLVRGKETFEARSGYTDDLAICLILFAWAIREEGVKELLELENNVFKQLKDDHIKTLYEELPDFFVDRGQEFL